MGGAGKLLEWELYIMVRGGNPEKPSRWRLFEKALSAALCGLKAQQVQSPGQRPGYHVPIPYAL